MDAQKINDPWLALVQIHNHTKVLIILAEELEPDKSKTFLQPVIEFRSALDHIVRAKAEELCLNGRVAAKAYIDSSYQKLSSL